jgi:hypothetical protein
MSMKKLDRLQTGLQLLRASMKRGGARDALEARPATRDPTAIEVADIVTADAVTHGVVHIINAVITPGVRHP